MNEVKLTIAGDFYVNDENNSSKLVGNILKDIFHASDFSIINLEAPIINNKEELRIEKTGPHLQINKDIAGFILKDLNVGLVTLANNHIMDYGSQGLKKTIDFCNEHNINYVGAGFNLDEAKNLFTLEIGGKRIAILNFAENEWAIAGEEKPGANPLDIIANVKDIQRAKHNHDVVLVIIHGGNEYNSYPSPRMVKQYRFYAENGASVIIGHHPHCISGYEVHEGVPIFYSLGNFLFTKQSIYEKWYEGLLLELIFKEDNSVKFNIHPTKVNKKTFNVHLAQGDKRKLILNKLQQINKVISDSKMLQNEWDKFIESKREQYLMSLSPFWGIKNKYFRAITFRSGLYKMGINTKYSKQLLNLIRCEAHLDVTKQVLEGKLK